MSESKWGYWSRLIAEQEASGQKTRAFCRERGIGEHSFYYWQKRPSEHPTVRFALLETKLAGAEMALALELVLSGGERLCIRAGVDGATLRVVDAVRLRMIHLPASVRVYLCLAPTDM